MDVTYEQLGALPKKAPISPVKSQEFNSLFQRLNADLENREKMSQDYR
jgi:hypothetical protein